MDPDLLLDKHFFLLEQPTRDWKGGEAVPKEWRELCDRNPGKPVKNGLLAIFYYRVFCENTPASLLRYDAPSMALLVEAVKNGKMSS